MRHGEDGADSSLDARATPITINHTATSAAYLLPLAPAPLRAAAAILSARQREAQRGKGGRS